MNEENKKNPNLKLVNDSMFEISVDKKEIDMLQENTFKRHELLRTLGSLEDDYMRQKTAILSAITNNSKALSNILNTLKTKYKIIGKIIDYDVKRKRLVITKDMTGQKK